MRRKKPSMCPCTVAPDNQEARQFNGTICLRTESKRRKRGNIKGKERGPHEEFHSILHWSSTWGLQSTPQFISDGVEIPLFIHMDSLLEDHELFQEHPSTPSIHLSVAVVDGEIIMSWLAYCSSCFPRSWLLFPPFHPLKRWEEQQSLGTCLFWGSPRPNYAEWISMVGHPQRHGRLRHLFFSSAITRGIMRWRGGFLIRSG